MTTLRRIAAVLIIPLLIGVTGCMGFGDSKQEMLDYLKDKYGVQFEATFYEKGSFVFPDLYGADKMAVRPKGKDIYAVVFEDTKGNGFHDNYGIAVLSEKFTRLNFDAVNKLDHRKKTFNFAIRTSTDVNKKEYLDHDVIKFIKEQTRDTAELVLYMGFVCDREPDQEQESKQLFKIYQFMKSLEKAYNKDFIVVVGYIKVEVYEKAQLLTALIPVYNANWTDLGQDVVYYQVRFDQSDAAASPQYFIDKFKRIEG